MLPLNVQVQTLKVDQIIVIPYDSQLLRVTTHIGGTPFDFQALLPVDLSTYKNAVEACDAFFKDGNNIKALLSAQPSIKWTAVAANGDPSKSPYALFTYTEQPNNRFTCEIETDELNQIITDLSVRFYEEVEAIINFGFNPEIIKSVFLGGEDTRYTSDVNCIDFEEMLKLKSLEENSLQLSIKSTKLIDASKVKLEFTIESGGLEHEDYLCVDSIAIFNVNYGTRKATLRRIVSKGFTPYFYDEEEFRHLPMELPEFLDNLNLEMSNEEILDSDLADQAIERIICSEVVSNKINNLLF